MLVGESLPFIRHYIEAVNESIKQHNPNNQLTRLQMRGGRARYEIENETFNTLKNQGYQFEHNFGHGNQHLSTVFAYVMMLAFFVDQLQQLGCKLFIKALARLHPARAYGNVSAVIFFNFSLTA